MKFEASDKVASFSKKPLIPRGYYPAKLLKVEPYADKDGVLREGKFGRQVIFSFAIYKGGENYAPIEPMTHTYVKEGHKITEDVVLPKFVYFEYKDKKTGEYRTALTKNSALTKVYTSLGWKFSLNGVNSDDFVGKWVVVNVDEYDASQGDEIVKASTIKDLSMHPNQPKDMPVEHANELKPTVIEVGTPKVETPEFTAIKNKMKMLHQMREDGTLSEEGFKQAMEQLEAQLGKVGK